MPGAVCGKPVLSALIKLHVDTGVNDQTQGETETRPRRDETRRDETGGDETIRRDETTREDETRRNKPRVGLKGHYRCSR